jgi:hypothetical protein
MRKSISSSEMMSDGTRLLAKSDGDVVGRGLDADALRFALRKLDATYNRSSARKFDSRSKAETRNDESRDRCVNVGTDAQ